MEDLIFCLKKDNEYKKASTWEEIQQLMKEGYLGCSKRDYENVRSFYALHPLFSKLKAEIKKSFQISVDEIIAAKKGGRVKSIDKDYTFQAKKGETNLEIDPILLKVMGTMVFGVVFCEDCGISVELDKNDGKKYLNIVIRSRRSIREITDFLRLNTAYINNLLSDFPKLDMNLPKDTDIIINATGYKEIMENEEFKKRNAWDTSIEKVRLDKFRAKKKIDKAMKVTKK